MQALTLTNQQEKKARDDAVEALQDALAKTASGKFDAAMASYISAGDSLNKISSIPVATYLVAIDRLMQETGRKACRGGAPASVSAALSTGANLSCAAVLG